MMLRMMCSRRWKKWSAPGITITGSSCGSAQLATRVQRHRVVLFAVDHDGVGGHVFHRAAGDRGAHEHHALDRDTLGDMRLHQRAEGETRQSQRCVGKVQAALHGMDHGQQILGLAAPFVVRPLAGADAAEIRPHRDVTQFDKGLGQGLRHLVVQRAAVERMRVRHQRDAARRGGRVVDHSFNRAGRAGDQDAFRIGHDFYAQIFRRSTTWPFFRCDSTISSMSFSST